MDDAASLRGFYRRYNDLCNRHDGDAEVWVTADDPDLLSQLR